MPLYHKDATGSFVPFKAMPFPDLEKVLEALIEANPHVLLEDENVVIFARQPQTAFGKYPDLLAIDQTGACVIIELKRGETPRDVVAQALEYAAWVDSLTQDDLNDLARTYAANHNLEATSIEDLYRRAFVEGGANEDGPSLTDRITFNHRQRLIIVAEHFSPEVEQTLRYLRTKLGVDVTGLQLSVHMAGAQTVIATNIVVGRERPTTAAAKSSTAIVPEADDAIFARVKTDFVRHAVTAIEDWIKSCDNADLSVRHGPTSDHFIQLHNKTQVYYYYAAKWLYCNLYAASEEEAQTLRTSLSKPDEVRSSGSGIRFHVDSHDDLEVLKTIIVARTTATV